MSKVSRICFALLVAVALVSTANAAGRHIDYDPPLRNGGLTDTNINQVDNWSKGGDGPNPRLDNDRGGPDGSDWAIGGSEGSGASAPHDVYYWQKFDPIGGVGTTQYVELSGWTKAWAGWWGGEDFGWVQEAWLELWIDGSMVWREGSTNNTNRDQWTFHEKNWVGVVNTEPQAGGDGIEVRLHTIKGNDQGGTGGLGAIFFDSRYDDIRLNISDVVPEPSSIFALGSGMAAMAGMLIRRRKA